MTRAKWDRAAGTFDLMNGFGHQKRWEPVKREFFARMGSGRILFVAVGTGLDIPFFPEDKSLVGVDISDAMLVKARKRAAAYRGSIELRQMDVHDMPFRSSRPAPSAPFPIRCAVSRRCAGCSSPAGSSTCSSTPAAATTRSA